MTLKIAACLVALAGIGIIADGTFRDLGIILLIEAGVLLTLAEKQPAR